MEEELKEYLAQVPEECLGDVAGNLTVRGAWLDSMETEAGVVSIGFRATKQSLEGFSGWLAEATNGNGKFSENNSAQYAPSGLGRSASLRAPGAGR
jgi:predicted membrane GTPase involved in stress response